MREWPGTCPNSCNSEPLWIDKAIHALFAGFHLTFSFHFLSSARKPLFSFLFLFFSFLSHFSSFPFLFFFFLFILLFLFFFLHYLYFHLHFLSLNIFLPYEPFFPGVFPLPELPKIQTEEVSHSLVYSLILSFACSFARATHSFACSLTSFTPLLVEQ